MPKIKLDTVPETSGSNYPKPFDGPCQSRLKRAVGNAGGLNQFGVLHVTLNPGAWSSQRHCHSAEDEFVYIISGHPTLINDHGETPLSPGDMTAHPAGDGNAHHIINKTDSDVVFIVVGTRAPHTDHARYPDIDLDLPPNGTAERVYASKDGKPY